MKRQRRPQQTARANAALPSPQPEAAAPAKAEGGIRGWFQRLGAEVADGYDAAKDTVGEWAQTAGTVVDTVSEASDLDYDIGRNEEGSVVLSARGSLQDVLEIGVAAEQLPASYLALLSGATASDVLLTYTPGSGNVTATMSSLRVAPLNFTSFSADEALLTDASFSFTSGSFDLAGAKVTGVQSSLRAGSVSATNATYQGTDGPVTAASVTLTDFRATGTSSSDAPLADPSTTQLSFTVASASATGIDAGDTELDSASLSDVSGGLDAGDESAFLQAGSVKASGRSGDTAVGSAQASGLRVDVTNAGGGLPFLDEVPDHLAGDVRVSSVGVTDLDSPMIDAAALEVRDASAAGNLDDWSAQLAEVSGQGLAAGDALSADKGSVRDLSISNTPDRTRLDASSAELTGVGGDVLSAASIRGSGLSATLADGGNQASLGQGQVHDATLAGGTHLDSANVSGLSASSANDSYRLQLDSANATGIDAGDTTLDSASVRDLSADLDGTPDQLTGSARLSSASLTGLDSPRLDADTLDVRDASASGNLDDWSAKLAEVSGQGLAAADLLAADTASVRELSVSNNPSRTRLDADSAELSGVRANNLSAAEISGSGLSATLADGGAQASLGQGQVRDATLAGRTHLDSASVSGLSASRASDGYRLGLDRAAVDGLTDSSGASAEQLNLTDATVDTDAAGTQFTAGHIGARDAQLPSSGGTPDFDNAAFIRSVGDQVHDADIDASIDMVAGRHKVAGPLGVRFSENTRVEGSASVRDGAVSDVRASFDKEVDGPLWTKPRGAFTKNGRLMLDVGGWANQDITQKVREAVGLRGDGPLPNAEILMNEVARATSAASSGTTSGAWADVDSLRVKASIVLGAGTIGASGSSANLAAGNRVELSYSPQTGTVVHASEIRAQSSSSELGDADVRTGAVRASGLDVRAGDSFSASVDRVDASGARLQGQGTSGSAKRASAEGVELNDQGVSLDAASLDGVSLTLGQAPATSPDLWQGVTRGEQVLARGSRGDAVRALQQQLAAAGYNIDVDGVFGPGTEQVVRSFQADKGLGVDGRVGPQTASAMR